ncbi:hypothetical protein JIN85_09255 [Luteolibacter pohnpeiensis]|uniref:Uncharacterized protein n=1 Tax=Luteolibacter pohnpeiensis TaxID=454153 RepID=A0A934S5G3_9BACT|nr:hypothetical protein [Luteolibacter pohnpeiensis]MBK1882602.1 hypothetical protein [Luteolibacter pohnpeiensis]
MPKYLHPAQLNVLKRFSQANDILRNTSRASNPAWYQDALELDLQLHIRTDGANISCYLFERPENKWTAGPDLTHDQLQEPAKIQEFAKAVLEHARSLGATGLGVVLTIGDEFAITDLKLEFNDPAALPEIRERAVIDPPSVLEDASRDAAENSWRVLPYPGNPNGKIGTSIALSHHYQLFLDTLRVYGEAENFPIVTCALSAPLVALLGIIGTVTRNPDRPFVAILQYPWLTVLAFFNQQADLILLRTMQHRGLLRPANFRQAVATACTALEIVDPDLFIFPLGKQVDTNLVTDLGTTFPTSHLEVVRPRDTHGLPAWAIELIIATQPASEEHLPGITFDTFRREGWVFQNFLPPIGDAVGLFPTKSEIKLLRGLLIGRLALVGLVLLAFGWLTFSFSRKIFQPDIFFLKTSESADLLKRIAKLNIERKQTQQLENLLEDRSKAWTSMELLARLLPENCGVKVTSFNLSVRPQNTPGQPKVGFIKEWQIKGLTDSKGLDLLNHLNNNESIATHFAEIAELTGNTAFDPKVPTRTLVVSVKSRGVETSKSPKIEGTNQPPAYPYSFEFVITQRFESADPLAINVLKAP